MSGIQYIKAIILVSLFFLQSSLKEEKKSLTSSDPSFCRKIIKEMLDSIRHIQTLRYNLYSIERMGEKHLRARSEIKLNVSPRKLYFVNREKKMEILWKQGWNKNEALIKLNNFPYLSVSLDPYGVMMRKDQHHTIHELGFAYVGKLVALAVLKDPKHLQKYFSYKGDTIWNKRSCYVVENHYPDFKYFEYKVSKNETVTSIALKFGAPEYLVRYKNGLTSYFGAIKEGRKIWVPNNYSYKTILYIDKVLKLPINIKVYDDLGLYEGYEISNLIVDLGIPEIEFSREYKGYHFKQ